MAMTSSYLDLPSPPCDIPSPSSCAFDIPEPSTSTTTTTTTSTTTTTTATAIGCIMHDMPTHTLAHTHTQLQPQQHMTCSNNTFPVPAPMPLKDASKQRVILWLIETYERRSEGSTRKGSVYNDYIKWCSETNTTPMIAPVFGKLVKKAFPWVKSNRKGPRGHTTHHYTFLHRKNAPLTGSTSPTSVPASRVVTRKRSLSDPQVHTTSDGRRVSKSLIQMRREQLVAQTIAQSNAMQMGSSSKIPASLSADHVAGSSASFYSASTGRLSDWEEAEPSSYLADCNESRQSQAYLSSLTELADCDTDSSTWSMYNPPALPPPPSQTEGRNGSNSGASDEVRWRSIDFGTEYYHPATWATVKQEEPSPYPEENTSSPPFDETLYHPRTNFTFFYHPSDSEISSLDTLCSHYRALSSLYKGYYDKLFVALATGDLERAEHLVHDFWQQDIQTTYLSYLLLRHDIQCQMLDMDMKAMSELGDLLMSNPRQLRDGELSNCLFGLVERLSRWHDTALECPRTMYSNTSYMPIPSKLVAGKQAIVGQLTLTLAKRATWIKSLDVRANGFFVGRS